MSEWVNCPRCGTLMENLCACPNMHCADYALPLKPSMVLSADVLIKRLRNTGGWWEGDDNARTLLAPLVAELISLKAESKDLARWKREALTVEAWWKRVDDFVRAHPDVLLGSSVVGKTIEWLQQRDAMLLAFGQIKEVLSKIPPHLAVGSEARATINGITSLCTGFLEKKITSTPPPT
jgi:hypothetical protein